MGTFTWTDGRKYIGMWEDGKQHGQGTYLSIDGSKKSGIWKNGKKIHWVNEKDENIVAE